MNTVIIITIAILALAYGMMYKDVTRPGTNETDRTADVPDWLLHQELHFRKQHGMHIPKHLEELDYEERIYKERNR